MEDHVWASSIIDYCCRFSIDHFFVAPGSRCTPLTLAIARHNKAKVVQHFDERGLAFAALGYGRSTGKAAIFVCTSGTAVANAFPAVIEAATEGVPLLLFTADRPEELHQTGANQTIDQWRIFGNYPELFQQMPVPQDAGGLDDFLFPTLKKCLSAAKSGPVHLNWMFREPFTIQADDLQQTAQNPIASPGEVEESEPSLTVKTNGNTLIALGGCRPEEAKEAIHLAEKLNCPILTDITSGLKTASFELPTDFSLPKPETILHLGGRITSKSWHQWTQTLRDSGTQFVHLTPTGKVVNPNRLPQSLHRTSLKNLAEKVLGQPTSGPFLQAWRDAARQRDQIVEKVLANSEKLSEPAIANFFCKNCSPTEPLFVGNSMPIRDLEWYGTRNSDQPRPTFANRGASGIDGLIATATGMAIGAEKPATLILGDLSALHDLNSLALVASCPVPLTVVVINNQSGHIFDHLPVRSFNQFERFFATPHGFGFQQAAKMFGLPYRQIDSMPDLRVAFENAKMGEKSVVLEIATDRKFNTEIRQQIRQEIFRCSNNN